MTAAVTTMLAASREALAAVRSRVDPSAAGQVGRELFDVVTLLDRERSLRRSFADPSTEPSRRSALANQVLGGKVSGPTMDVLRAAVEQRWSSTTDFVSSLELLGQEALLRSAAESGQLDTVEDELFRVGRIVAGDTALERALSQRNTPVQGRQRLMAGLLEGKVTDVTLALVTQVVGRLRDEPADQLDALATLAAQQRRQSVAHVRSVVALTADQQRRLGQSLARIYGREMALHVEVDPSLIGGLVVQVGDEVIDGSTAGRIANVRSRFGR